MGDLPDWLLGASVEGLIALISAIVGGVIGAWLGPTISARKAKELWILQEQVKAISGIQAYLLKLDAARIEKGRGRPVTEPPTSLPVPETSLSPLVQRYAGPKIADKWGELVSSVTKYNESVRTWVYPTSQEDDAGLHLAWLNLNSWCVEALQFGPSREEQEKQSAREHKREGKRDALRSREDHKAYMRQRRLEQ